MANLPIGEKVRRVTGFMIGLSNRQVRRALAAFGFTDAVAAEGMALLTAVIMARLGAMPVIDPNILGELDAWENRWFPVIEVVLRTNFPDVHAVVFRNLTQTEGVEVVASVSTLLSRLDLVVQPAADGGMGERGQAAVRRLVERGVSESVTNSARDLLGRVGTSPEPDLLEPESPDSAQEAEAALWNWYLEWSGIARIAIRNRRLLRALGFLRTVRRPDGTEEDVIVDDEEAVTDPTPMPLPVPPPAPAPDPGPTPDPTDDPTDV